MPNAKNVPLENYDIAVEDISNQDDEEFIPLTLTHNISTVPHLINQYELNILVRDLKLTKDQSQFLSSRLKEWNLLEENTKISYFKTCQKDFSIHFEMNDSLCYYNKVEGL